MNFDEITIIVPWGHIAAKAWGNQEDPIVLVIHGIMDNAGSFDRLIPLLPRPFYYICIDLPGHGKSSHLPPFLPIHTINNVLVYKLILQHFKREKYTILGHSYGGQIGFLFAQLYPQYIEKLIMLDTVHLYPVETDHFGDYLRDTFDNCLAVEEKLKTRPAPTYSYAEVMQKLKKRRHNGAITKEAVEALLPRAITPTEDGKYVFTMDQRLKYFMNPLLDYPYILETIKKFPVTCPVLILLARESKLHQKAMKSVIDFLKQYKNVTIMHVDGHHDVHNNNPENVAPHISKFLATHKGKL